MPTALVVHPVPRGTATRDVHPDSVVARARSFLNENVSAGVIFHVVVCILFLPFSPQVFPLQPLCYTLCLVCFLYIHVLHLIQYIVSNASRYGTMEIMITWQVQPSFHLFAHKHTKKSPQSLEVTCFFAAEHTAGGG